MATIDVTVYYLEMLACTARSVPAPRTGLCVLQAKQPTVAFYRFLYDSVGKDYYWLSRRRLADAELAALINDPRDEVHVLYVEGVPAGFAELDRRIENEVELVQFGLMREFIGQGLGKYFLQWAIDDGSGSTPARWTTPAPYPTT
jgi:GNAT superfamily N-acetyltransferase